MRQQQVHHSLAFIHLQHLADTADERGLLVGSEPRELAAKSDLQSYAATGWRVYTVLVVVVKEVLDGVLDDTCPVFDICDDTLL